MYEKGIIVREPREGDVEVLAELVYRFYMLNEEFDPLWSLADNAKSEARREAERLVKGSDMVLVVEAEGRVVGYIRGYFREMPMLRSRVIAVVRELYVHPSFRGLGIGSLLIERFIARARENGARAIAVEFPTQNVIAERFYDRLDFRRFMNVYIKEV